jgi:hypothetical protein
VPGKVGHWTKIVSDTVTLIVQPFEQIGESVNQSRFQDIAVIQNLGDSSLPEIEKRTDLSSSLTSETGNHDLAGFLQQVPKAV